MHKTPTTAAFVEVAERKQAAMVAAKERADKASNAMNARATGSHWTDWFGREGYTVSLTVPSDHSSNISGQDARIEFSALVKRDGSFGEVWIDVRVAGDKNGFCGKDGFVPVFKAENWLTNYANQQLLPRIKEGMKAAPEVEQLKAEVLTAAAI